MAIFFQRNDEQMSCFLLVFFFFASSSLFLFLFGEDGRRKRKMENAHHHLPNGFFGESIYIYICLEFMIHPAKHRKVLWFLQTPEKELLSLSSGYPPPTNSEIIICSFLWRAPYKPSLSTVSGPGIPPKLKLHCHIAVFFWGGDEYWSHQFFCCSQMTDFDELPLMICYDESLVWPPPPPGWHYMFRIGDSY